MNVLIAMMLGVIMGLLLVWDLIPLTRKALLGWVRNVSRGTSSLQENRPYTGLGPWDPDDTKLTPSQAATYFKELLQAQDAPQPDAYAKAAESYAVSGTPRHVPWHQRRKELEAQHRTKRQELEALREAE